MKLPLPAHCELLAARVRLADTTVGTIIRALGADQYEFTNAEGVRIISAADVTECGDDVKRRTAAYCKLHGIRFVSMFSLSR